MRALPKKLLSRAAAAALSSPFSRRPEITPVEREYLAREDELFAHLRVNGSRAGLDVLALAASRGRHRAEELLDAVRHGSRSAVRLLIAGLAREPALHLATLLADQARDITQTADAALLLRAMADHLGPQAIRKDGRFLLVESLIETDQAEDLPALIAALHIGRENAVQPFLYTANARNPFRGSGGEEPEAIASWLVAMNEAFAVDGLEPIDITPLAPASLAPDADAPAPFDRIVSHAARHVDGPLVTVIIPTYDPGPRLSTAIESLLAQSHRSLQILIVDDASPQTSAEALDRWAEHDARIEVVHLPENNGPYLARNIGASQHARGDYVTIHDDDDWSHPRKIELQVAQLEAERHIMANMSHSVRASDDLRLGRVNGNPVWTQQGLNSLMVRRSVFDEIGYWDVLNRSADAEFNDRIRAWTGTRIPVIGRAPLTLYRIRWDSLSAGEFHRGYMDPRRRWYFQSYRHWHAASTKAGLTLALPVDDRGTRPFSAPADLLGSRAKTSDQPLSVDVVLAADFRLGGSPGDTLGEEIERALADGTRIALLQLDSPAIAQGEHLPPRILAAALHPHAHVLSLADAVAAEAVVILDPTILQFVRAERSAISTPRLILSDHAKHPPRAGGALTDPSDIAAACERVFGLRPETPADAARPLSLFSRIVPVHPRPEEHHEQ